MKYGRLITQGVCNDINNKLKRVINLGDIWENMALEEIYRRLHLSEDEIINCYQFEVKDYMGEYMVAPVNEHLLTVNYSSRILPVFVGISLRGQHHLSESEENILRRFSPVGCRDERTLRMLLDKGIDAYFSGCIVATFPKRKDNPNSQDTVFFADANAGIKEYMPIELLKKYKLVYHETYVFPDELGAGDIPAYGRKMLDMYANEAKLVVTSRFHSAVMCLALGIPVIVTIENFNFKYTWLKKYIPIYEPKDFSNIDWNPKPVAIPDEEKELMLAVACERMKETYNKYYKICKLSECRETFDSRTFEDIFYGQSAIEYIKNNWSSDTSIEYSFWGATYTAKKINEFIEKNYKYAKLKKVYDMLVERPFLGMLPTHPDEIDADDTSFFFVASNTAIVAAEEKFERCGRDEKSYFMCNREFIKQKDFNDIIALNQEK